MSSNPPQGTEKYKVLDFSSLAALWPPFREDGGWFSAPEDHRRFVNRIKHMTSVRMRTIAAVVASCLAAYLQGGVVLSVAGDWLLHAGMCFGKAIMVCIVCSEGYVVG